MRQLLKADDHGVAVDCDAERQRQRELRLFEGVVFDHGAQRDAAAFGVRYLDADIRFAGDRSLDAQARDGHRERDVVRERGDFADLYARSELDAELNDRRPDEYLREARLDAELFERIDYLFAERFGALLVHLTVAGLLRSEEFDRRREYPLFDTSAGGIPQAEVGVLDRGGSRSRRRDPDAVRIVIIDVFLVVVRAVFADIAVFLAALHDVGSAPVFAAALIAVFIKLFFKRLLFFPVAERRQCYFGQFNI